MRGQTEALSVCKGQLVSMCQPMYGSVWLAERDICALGLQAAADLCMAGDELGVFLFELFPVSGIMAGCSVRCLKAVLQHSTCWLA